MNVLDTMKQEAKCYNKHLSDTYLDTLTPLELLAYCHPFERAEYVIKLNKEGLITDTEKQVYRQMVINKLKRKV
ncbi:MAG: hypothetical protein ACLFVR_14695 [Thiohalospira sp.]